MKPIIEMRSSRQGVSTLFIAIVIVIIVVIIAVAAYVLLTDNNNNNEETLAPGTTMTYDVTDDGAETGTLEQTIVGQSSTDYFVESKLTGDKKTIQYSLSKKGTPDGAVTTGTEDLETFEGTKTLTVWEYMITDPSGGTQAVTAYINPENGVVFKNVIVYNDLNSTTDAQKTEVQTLTAYDLVWQTSYNVSDSVGKAYEYAYILGPMTLSVKIVCVADCQNDQYGIVYDYSETIENLKDYFLSDNPQGLPEVAVDTGQTTTLTGTIDGDVTVELWSISFESGDSFNFYCDPDTHVIYKFVISAKGNDSSYDLVSKP
ncbi:MAG: hypothetical protein FWF07_01420 [Methanomassiliicoccaceae archaeon]|nr:hypothetical protein [Methanomassiliicoccaceae archaeon]